MSINKSQSSQSPQVPSVTSERAAQIMPPASAAIVAGALQKKQIVATIVKQVMEEGVHYGQIPGTKNNALFQPGAHQLLIAFELYADTSKVDVIDLGDGHREYVTYCDIYNKEGKIVNRSTGSCSTKEARYAFRGTDGTPTGNLPPKLYWQYLKGDPKESIAPNLDKAQELIGGKGFIVKKNEDGQWEIYQKGEGKKPNDCIADCYNTCRKISAKRSLVGGTITVTGCSDSFTQDLEELAEERYNFAMRSKVSSSAPKNEPRNLSISDIQKSINLLRKYSSEPATETVAFPLVKAAFSAENAGRIDDLKPETIEKLLMEIEAKLASR